MNLRELREAVKNLPEEMDYAPVKFVDKRGNVHETSDGIAYQGIMDAVTFTEKKGK